MAFKLNDPVSVIPGAGKKISDSLRRRNIKTLYDLLYFLPRRYIDRSLIRKIAEAKHGEVATFYGALKSITFRKSRQGIKLTEGIIFDGTGYLYLVWFGERKLEKYLREGIHLSVSGKVEFYKGRIQIQNPEFDILEEDEDNTLRKTGQIFPLYPAIEGVSPNILRKLILFALENTIIPELIPADILISEELFPGQTALYEAHFPSSKKNLEAALYRLKFEEIFILQSALAAIKKQYKDPQKGIVHDGSDDKVKLFLKETGFKLTESQASCIKEIIEDMKKPEPMNRLLQGDVGSGKTVVALTAAVFAASSGYQTAFMAPTEVLAYQQFQKYKAVLEATGIKSCIITGSTKTKEKKKLLEGIAEGNIDIVFGTHTLIYDEIVFGRLGMVIIDEQHRFGTMQRLLLRKKGKNPDLLIISATPIPRTLALTVYGDLDVSTLKEHPGMSGIEDRIETVVLASHEYEKAYRKLSEEVKEGRKGFVIVPLVEESEKINASSIEKIKSKLTHFIPEEKIGILHGRQPAEEKIDIIRKLREGLINVLLSTTVVEVGIDIPDATVMIIEDADRFGLSQLHQLRGRVGRGGMKAFVFALSSFPTENSAKRLEIFSRTSDGFLLAEEDLKMRGEGEITGQRQSGASDLKLARYASDRELLEKVRELSFSLFEKYKPEAASIKIILEEASSRFGNLEMVVEAK